MIHPFYSPYYTRITGQKNKYKQNNITNIFLVEVMSMDEECKTEFKKIRDEIENLKKEIENLKKGRVNEKEDLGDLFDASEVD